MIIWLASYPKSGNTWVRSIIAALMYTDNGVFNFSLLDKIKQFPSDAFFEGLSNNLSNINEIAKHWETAQELINLDNQIKFLKTHHLKCKINEHNFTSNKNTLATIYIVRDPRNLVSSISNHYSKSLEEAKEFMFTPKYLFGFKKDGNLKKDGVKTILGTWSEHYKFWKTNNENYLLIKYEDLINNRDIALNKILRFINELNGTKLEINQKKFNNVVKTTSFERMKNLERTKGFFEAKLDLKTGKKIPFFNLGEKNDWKKFLNVRISNKIEKAFKNEMIELGYL